VEVAHLIDSSAETHVADLQHIPEEIASTLKQSPLAQREGVTFEADDTARKMVGWSGDHAAAVKKSGNNVREWKTRVNIEDLGYDKLHSMPPHEMETLARSTLDETAGCDLFDSSKNAVKVAPAISGR
jgi:hypothetical protein